MVRRLGDILIEERLITPAQRDEALRQQKLYGGRIGTNLFELGAIDLEGLARGLSRQKGVPAALQKHFDSIHGEAVALVPAHLAQKHRAIPLGFTGRTPKTIAVAFLDPTRPGAVDEIQVAASARVYPVVAPELQIYLYLEKLYGIPRHVRFLRLERPSQEGAGRWSPMSTPASDRSPPFLSAPETPPEGIPAADPKAFFDMSRPDLSRPGSAPAMLLTDALPSERPATSAKSPGPATQSTSPARAPASGAAEPPPPRAKTNPDLNAAQVAPRLAPAPPSVAAAPRAPARKPTREGTPRPLPSHPGVGADSPTSPLSTGAPPGRAAPVSATSSGQPASTSSSRTSPPSAQAPRHARPTPIASAGVAPSQRGDTVLPRTARGDVSSRAPTIPEIPAFSIRPGGGTVSDREKPNEPAPDPKLSEALRPATTRRAEARQASIEHPSSSTAPTIKIEDEQIKSLHSSSADQPSPSRSPTIKVKLGKTESPAPPIPIDLEFIRSGAWDDDEPPPITPAPPPITSAQPAAPTQVSSAPSESSEATRAAGADSRATIAIGSASSKSLPESDISDASSSSAFPASEPTPSPDLDAVPRPWSAAEAVDAMATAADRDQIADAMVNYLRATCGVGLVFIVQHEVALGWKGFAPAVSSQEIDALAIPLAVPSLLQVAYRRQTVFRGPPPMEGAALDGQLWAKLGSSAPKEAIVAPILIRDRLVNLVYGHAADGGPLPDRLLVGLSTLVRAASAAYVRLIQEAKKRSAS